jgi:hypothetical protein
LFVYGTYKFLFKAKTIKNLLKIFHYLSLDVVFGAVLSSWAFWKLPDGNAVPNLLTLLVLGSTTWILYILDRLLDLRIYPQDHTIRHQFHFTHQYDLQITLLCLVVLNGVLLSFLPETVIWYGVLLAVGVGFYFWVLNRFFRNNKAQWVKEPTTAICYTLAVVGTALINKSSINLSAWILSGLFFLIALQNLLIFSYFELKQSVDNENLVSIIGENLSKQFIYGITSINVLIIVLFFMNGAEYVHYFAGMMLLMTLSLSFLIAIPNWALRNDRYRWLGDGVFLLPALLLFF